jgi:hypothetical protein
MFCTCKKCIHGKVICLCIEEDELAMHSNRCDKGCNFCFNPTCIEGGLKGKYDYRADNYKIHEASHFTSVCDKCQFYKSNNSNCINYSHACNYCGDHFCEIHWCDKCVKYNKDVCEHSTVKLQSVELSANINKINILFDRLMSESDMDVQYDILHQVVDLLSDNDLCMYLFSGDEDFHGYFAHIFQIVYAGQCAGIYKDQMKSFYHCLCELRDRYPVLHNWLPIDLNRLIEKNSQSNK